MASKPKKADLAEACQGWHGRGRRDGAAPTKRKLPLKLIIIAAGALR